jgi:hypothetical protein
MGTRFLDLDIISQIIIWAWIYSFVKPSFGCLRISFSAYALRRKKLCPACPKGLGHLAPLEINPRAPCSLSGGLHLSKADRMLREIEGMIEREFLPIVGPSKGKILA